MESKSLDLAASCVFCRIVTGEQYFLDTGDRIWKDFMDFGWAQIAGRGGKQFSQNYHWSFGYVRWRKMSPEPDLKAIELKAANSK